MSQVGRRSGGEILVQALRTHGVQRVFCVPGESYLAVLDALYEVRDDVRLVVCRQEGGAAFMAEAEGKLTGRPGICFVTRGPGATNAAIGVHTAFQDSSPMILFIGQVARDQSDREAFQEIDFRRMFGEMAKWVAQIDDAARIPEYLHRAFSVACSGRPGPVVLALPEDMLRDEVETADTPPAIPVMPHPAPQAMARLREMLAAAQRPMLVIGGAGWDEAASAGLAAFARAWHLPVACAFRRQDSFDNGDPLYAGDIGFGVNPALARRLKQADLVIAVGPRLGEVTSGGYTLFESPLPRQTLVHVHPDPEELNRVYHAALPICSGMAAFAAAAALAPPAEPAWRDWTAAAHADYLAFSEPPRIPGPVQMGEIMATLRQVLPPDAILTNGAGNFATWAHRFYRFRRFGCQLGPTNGAMGYGVPAGIAAALARPDRVVVSFTGDGDFLMTGQELATAVQQQARLVVLLVNNGIYGTIRMHQERRYPGRVHGSTLGGVDFVALAQAYGAQAERIARTEDFAPAFARALAAERPVLLEIVLDPEAITPNTTLAEIRRQARGD